MTALVNKAFAIVAADPRPRLIRELRQQLQSSKRDTRLVALVRIREQIARNGLRSSYFALVEPLTVDADSTCRWQATIVIGEFIETHPDKVWQVARTLAVSPKADIRTAAATVLLEHLLERYPARMTSLFEHELALGNRRFVRAVSMCFNFGKTTAARNRIQRVLNWKR